MSFPLIKYKWRPLFQIDAQQFTWLDWYPLFYRGRNVRQMFTKHLDSLLVMLLIYSID